jgi:hypothetical protein
MTLFPEAARVSLSRSAIAKGKLSPSVKWREVSAVTCTYIRRALIILALLSAPASHADIWCTVTDYGVSENSGSITMHGILTSVSGSSSGYKSWINLGRTSDASAAKTRMSIVLTALAMGRPLRVYVAATSCSAVPDWTMDSILHLQVNFLGT